VCAIKGKNLEWERKRGETFWERWRKKAKRNMKKCKESQRKKEKENQTKERKKKKISHPHCINPSNAGDKP